VTEIDAHARVLSQNVVASPLSGARGAFVHVELLEEEALIGQVTFGDIVRFAIEPEGSLDVLVRRAECMFHSDVPAATLERFVPELAGLLARARGGQVRYREHVIACGDRVRIRAHVEGGLVRHDLGTVRIQGTM
jgi:hypothetical protein